MPARVDFSPAAASYDGRHGGLSIANASELARAAGIAPGSELLEVGAGTGRVAIPFAGLGFRVTAVEPADGMLQVLREKAGALPVTVLRGEGAKLPFDAAHFDAILIARLLYVMPDWRDVLAEIRRVFKPGAPLLHEWGNGAPDEEWLEMREKARELFEAAGVVDPFHPGARTEAQVEAELAKLHFKKTAERRFAGDFSYAARGIPLAHRDRQVLVHLERPAGGAGGDAPETHRVGGSALRPEQDGATAA